MNKKIRRRGVGRERYWRGMIRKRQRSGLTIRAFCARERVTESAYHFWRRELLKRDSAGERSSSRRGQGSKTVVPMRGRPTFASVTLADTSAAIADASVIEPSMPLSTSMPIEIVLRNHVRVRVGSDANLQWLDQVLRVVEQRPC